MPSKARNANQNFQLLLLFSLLILAWLLSMGQGPTTTRSLHPSTSTVRCEEDQPCWDCTRMGNGLGTCPERNTP